MSKILSIAWNDVRIEFADRSTLFFFLILPIIFTVVLANVIGGGDTKVPLLVVDQDGSDISKSLVSQLQDATILRVRAEMPDVADKAFKNKEAPALLTIPPGFSKAVLAGQQGQLTLREDTTNNSVLAIDQAVNAASAQVSNSVLAANAAVSEAERVRPFPDDAARQTYFNQSLAAARDYLQNPPVKTQLTQPAAASSKLSPTGAQQSSAGEIVVWVLFTLLGAAELLVNERIGGTLRRLVVTPTSKATILLGKITGRLGMGIVQMLLLILFGALALGVDWGKSPLALALVMLSFALCAVALGILFGTFVKTRGQATGIVIFASMMLASLGGAWWPLEITPPLYQQVVRVLPTTWAMQGFTDVIVSGKGVVDILPVVGVLLLFAVVFFALGIWRFRFAD